MSDLDIVQHVLQERARITKETEKFFSSDLDDKIKEFQRLREELDALGKEIAVLAGSTKGSAASSDGAKTKGRKKGGRKLATSEVKEKVLEYLGTLGSGSGAAGKTIADKLHDDHWSEVPSSTVYSKAMKFLNEEHRKPNPKVKKEGELINSRWSLC